MLQGIEKDPYFARDMDIYVPILQSLTKIYQELKEMADADLGGEFEGAVYEVMDKIVYMIGRMLFDIYIHGYLTIQKE